MKGKVENITEIEKFEDIVEFAKSHSIDLVCIGPEQPLVDGLCDLMENEVNSFQYKIFSLLKEYSMCWTLPPCFTARVFEGLVKRLYEATQYTHSKICKLSGS